MKYFPDTYAAVASRICSIPFDLKKNKRIRRECKVERNQLR